jgi:hypothetical protein
MHQLKLPKSRRDAPAPFGRLCTMGPSLLVELSVRSDDLSSLLGDSFQPSSLYSSNAQHGCATAIVIVEQAATQEPRVHLESMPVQTALDPHFHKLAVLSRSSRSQTQAGRDPRESGGHPRKNARNLSTNSISGVLAPSPELH